MDIMEFENSFVVNQHLQCGRIWESDTKEWFLELAFTGGATFRAKYETQIECETVFNNVKLAVSTA